MSERTEAFIQATYDVREQEIMVRKALNAVNQKQLEVKECELELEDARLELERRKKILQDSEQDKERGFDY